MNFAALLRSIPGGAAQGLIWGILSIGVFITYKILDFADLTVDGSLATGGAVAAVSVAAGIHPLLAMLFAFLAGAAAGAVTALLNTKLKIPAILSGILTMSALYSVNFRIMKDSNTVAINRADTYNGMFAKLFVLSAIDDKNLLSIISASILIVAIIALLYWFFGTETGSAIRATGCNEKMARAQGINTDAMKLTALSLSNGFAALAGSLIAQHNGAATLEMAQGTIVIGLASVVIGDLIFGGKVSFWLKLTGVVVGSVLYRLVFTLALWLGLKSTDLNLVTTIIIVVALCAPNVGKIFVKRRRKNA